MKAPADLRLAVVLAAALLAVPADAGAEWVRAQGERIFPPDVAEAEACRAAEDRAREDAVRQVTGERLSSEEMMRCSERGSEAECIHNSSVWSIVDGDVRSVRNRVVELGNLEGGIRRCTVSLEAEVVVPPGRADPSFDVGVRLNATLFRDREAMVIAVSPNRTMAVAVFQWLPYARGEAQVARLFPNPYDPPVRTDRPFTIPSDAGSRRYTLRVAFPEGMPAARNVVDEYLMVVATRRPVEFRESYALDDFRARLLELPRGDCRLVRKAYSVVRGNP